jgi:hypothetical protein
VGTKKTLRKVQVTVSPGSASIVALGGLTLLPLSGSEHEIDIWYPATFTSVHV